MKVLKSTVEYFKNKGITIRPRFEEFTEDNKNTWFNNRTKTIREHYQYMMKWDGEKFIKPYENGITEEQVQKEAQESFDRFMENEYWQMSNNIWVFMEDGFCFCIKNLQKYKVYDKDFIEKKINTQLKKYTSKYGDFAKKVQKMMQNEGLGSFFVYPTTYGIGVWQFYNFKANEDTKIVRKTLNKLGIEYSNEWSNAGWVFRFKISKKTKF